MVGSDDAFLAALRARIAAGDAILPLLQNYSDAHACTTDVLAEHWQRALQTDDRRRASGVYYTDHIHAARLATHVLRGLGTPPARILEPTCGGGMLLAALLNAARAAFPTLQNEATFLGWLRGIHAWDLDPVGLWLAQHRIRALFGDNACDAIAWKQCDALAEVPAAPFDLVFANPPYGNAIERSTLRNEAERKRFVGAFPWAARGAFDKCALFVEYAAQHCAPAGTVCIILPQAWLAQPASEALRAHLSTRFDLTCVHTLRADAFFESAVQTVALTLVHAPEAGADSDAGADCDTARRRNDHTTTLVDAAGATRHVAIAPMLRSGRWGSAMHDAAPLLAAATPHLAPLATLLRCSAGATTDEAYQWKPFVFERGSRAPEDARPLLIAGVIEPFALLWGETTTRYLGEKLHHPMIDLSGLSSARQRLAGRPRALLPTLSRALEAWPDIDGSTVGAVSTIAVWHPDEEAPGTSDQPRAAARARRVAAVMNSAWSRLSYHCLFSMLALSGGNVQVSSNKLAELHLCATWLTFPTDEALDEARGDARSELDHALASLPRLSLGKCVPTLTQLAQLLDAGVMLRSAIARDRREAAVTDCLLQSLDQLLASDARDAMQDGRIDAHLFALAPELTRELRATLDHLSSSKAAIP